MRPIVIGLFAALMAVAAFPAAALAAGKAPEKVTAEARQQGMKDAPGIIQKTGLDCSLADARKVGDSRDPKTHLVTHYYEIACKGAEGFVVGMPEKAGPQPQIYTCLELASTPNAPITCVLPANADPKAGLAALVAKDKPDCKMTDAKAIGQAADRTQTVFEVACQGGAGYIVNTSFPFSVDKPATFNPCLGYGANTSLKCTLTSQAAQAAYFNSLVSKIGKPCTPKAHRFVGATSDGKDYYEVACQDGKGYMFDVAANDQVGQAIDCAVADNIGGGCTLTNAREAETEQASLYSKLAQQAGFNCQVSKYSPFDMAPPGHEAVELACSNRPDGAVGIFPANPSGKSIIYDCAHSELAGYRCSFSQPSAAYPQLTQDLRRVGKTSCAVSGERVVGKTAADVGYLEVACADGNPGFMISYDVATMTPKQAVSCPLARDIAGGCQMPQNQPKHG